MFFKVLEMFWFLSRVANSREVPKGTCKAYVCLTHTFKISLLGLPGLIDQHLPLGVRMVPRGGCLTLGTLLRGDEGRDELAHAG